MMREVRPMDDIQIKIPDYIEDDAELADWLTNNPDMLAGAMDLEADQFDSRATVDDVRIERVEIDGESIAISYEYEYSVFAGCRDMNYSDTVDGLEIVGERQGRVITFPRFKPTEKRSTLDEF